MRLLTIAVLVSVLMLGCGGEDGPGDAIDHAGSAPSPLSSSGPVTEPPEDLPIAPPEKSRSTIRQLSGRVSEGVEAGCLLLAASDGLYLLVGSERAMLRSGADVVVTGTVEQDLFTTCQQGTPFRVRTVRTA